MIDTIALKSSMSLSEGSMDVLASNGDPAWTVRTEELRRSKGLGNRKTIEAFQKERGQCAHIDEEGSLSRLECSMARRLFGANGIQLKSDSHLQAARALLLEDARYFVPGLTKEDLRIQRLDLALTIHTSPVLLDLHRHAVHPMIRREKELYCNHGKTVRTEEPMSSLRTVRFRGVKTVIQLYDKLAEVRQKKGLLSDERAHAVRVEVQLKGDKHIAKLFGRREAGFITLADLELEACYRVFRSILLKFDNLAKVPASRPGTAFFLAILERHPETWGDLGGIEPLDWYRRSKGLSKKRFRDLRHKVSAQQFHLHPLRWSDILPEDRLPDLVDIDMDGNAKIISSPWSFVRAAASP